MAFNSDHFDLSNWKLTLPVDSSGGIGGNAVEVINLVGYENASYFYDAPDGSMVFRAAADGATTGGSKYPRSELREMKGSERAAWKLSEGGTMTATLEVDAVPTKADGTPGRVIVGQIHGQEEELIRLYWEKGSVYFMNDRAGAGNTETRFDFRNAAGEVPNVGLNERFSYKIDARGDTMVVQIYADGDVYTSTSKLNSVWQSDTFYFKAGVYLGVNETSGSGVGQVSFYGLDFGHTAGSGLGGLTTGPVTPPDDTDPPPVLGPYDATAQAREDARVQGTLVPTDPDSVTFSYSLTGRAPAGFALDSSGTWTFDASAPSYQALKSGAQSDVIVRFIATDANGTDSAANTLTITVTGANDAPTDAEIDDRSIAENAANGSVVGRISAVDVDEGDQHSFSLRDDAGGRFAVNAATGVLTVANGLLLDHEAAASHGVVVRVTDAAGAFHDETLTIGIGDVDEGGPSEPPPQTNPLGGKLTSRADHFAAETSDDFILDGLGQNDRLFTRSGNDRVRGNAGNDTIDTSSGDDVITFKGNGDGFDWIDGGGGFDRIIALADHTSIGLMSLGGMELISANGKQDVVIRASAFDDHFNFTDVTLEGIDRIDTGYGDDTVFGSSAGDTIRGGFGIDDIKGGEGDDRLYGDSGTDTVRGGDGNDTMFGGFGEDNVYGDDGNDFIRGNNGADRIEGGEGDDRLDGGEGNDLVKGGEGDDILTGGQAYGGLDNDRLEGGSGSDELHFRLGNDILIGGDGEDVFVIDDIVGGALFGRGTATITDFDTDERIDVTGVFSNFSGVSRAAAEIGEDVQIRLGAGRFVLIEDVSLASLSEENFLF